MKYFTVYSCFTNWNDSFHLTSLSVSLHSSLQCRRNTIAIITSALSSSSSSSTTTTTPSTTRRKRLFATPYNEGEENRNDDQEFMKDLYKAKLDKLGMMIPEEQVKQSAQALEHEFLSAMKHASIEFEEAKKKYGADGAIEKWKEEWDEQDEEREEKDDDDCYGFQ